jgi:hypothetical protein
VRLLAPGICYKSAGKEDLVPGTLYSEDERINNGILKYIRLEDFIPLFIYP